MALSDQLEITEETYTIDELESAVPRRSGSKHKKTHRRAHSHSKLKSAPSQSSEQSGVLDMDLLMCPITLELMTEPVVTKYGHSFERDAIIDWVTKHSTCPLTQLPLSVHEIFPCFGLKNIIVDLLRKNPDLAPIPSANFNSVRRVQSKNNCPLTTVINRGSIQIPPHLVERGVTECTVEEVNTKLRCKIFGDRTTFLDFPSPEEIFVLRSTGYLILKNEGVHPVILCSYKAENGRAMCVAEYSLMPGETEGFNIRGCGWTVEVRKGDASKLVVVDFDRKMGGNKSNKLGMA
eukprot:TRINITY_DN8796_c0_g1_i1.p1 TRINITY_DN8796_c0_g1~~TRINITY_DN8796_c0_g1_i1.p1  ORF type:complete len:292 (-),score=38.06 TRINITY_DN8796_c0_g1_i1:35-910(-)